MRLKRPCVIFVRPSNWRLPTRSIRSPDSVSKRYPRSNVDWLAVFGRRLKAPLPKGNDRVVGEVLVVGFDDDEILRGAIFSDREFDGGLPADTLLQASDWIDGALPEINRGSVSHGAPAGSGLLPSLLYEPGLIGMPASVPLVDGGGDDYGTNGAHADRTAAMARTGIFIGENRGRCPSQSDFFSRAHHQGVFVHRSEWVGAQIRPDRGRSTLLKRTEAPWQT